MAGLVELIVDGKNTTWVIFEFYWVLTQIEILSWIQKYDSYFSHNITISLTFTTTNSLGYTLDDVFCISNELICNTKAINFKLKLKGGEIEEPDIYLGAYLSNVDNIDGQ